NREDSMSRFKDTRRKRWRYRARVILERLEDRCVPSAGPFDPFAADPFPIDHSLTHDLPHATGDLAPSHQASAESSTSTASSSSAAPRSGTGSHAPGSFVLSSVRCR